MLAWKTARDARKKVEQTKKKDQEKEKAVQLAKRTGPRSHSVSGKSEKPEKSSERSPRARLPQKTGRPPLATQSPDSGSLSEAEKATLAVVAVLKEHHKEAQARETTHLESPCASSLQDHDEVRTQNFLQTTDSTLQAPPQNHEEPERKEENGPTPEQPPEAKPAVTYQRSEKPTVPLSKLSEFFPMGGKWEVRWEGESLTDDRERTGKHRNEWISRFATTVKRGNPKQKRALEYYQDLVKSGQSPQPYREPTPVVENIPLNVDTLLHFPGDECWAWRWEGENEVQWWDRLKRGYLEWSRYIDSVKLSRKATVKEQVGFYVDLMKEGKSPVPVPKCNQPGQLSAKQADLQSVQEQKNWIDRVQGEIPVLMQAWREDMIQS